jgi:YHS domain-containing protein
MKTLKKIIALALLLPCLAAPLAGLAQDAKPAKAVKVKPYPMDTCVVSDEKIDTSADAKMKPYTFTYEGQEVKLCCKSCEKDFKKEPAKYIKKITEAADKAKTPAKAAK